VINVKILKSLPGVVVTFLGQPLRIQCVTSGIPAPRVSWIKHTLPNVFFVVEEDGTLYISNVSNPLYSGIYQCVAETILDNDRIAASDTDSTSVVVIGMCHAI